MHSYKTVENIRFPDISVYIIESCDNQFTCLQS